MKYEARLASDRRQALVLDWIRADPDHQGLSSHTICLRSDLYVDTRTSTAEEKALFDLACLQEQGLLIADREITGGWWPRRIPAPA